MYRLLFFSWIFSIFLLFGFGGCSANLDGPYDYDCLSSTIDVSPGIALKVGFFEEQIFEISLRDPYDQPIAYGQVIIDFIGPAHNASIELDPKIKDNNPYLQGFFTDDRGIVSVLFTAPDTATQFSIRFSSPDIMGEDYTVDVLVDPSILNVSIPVDYKGSRKIAFFKADLFEAISCDDIYKKYGELSPVASVLASLPDTAYFDGLRNNYNYAVNIAGLDSHGKNRATACRELKPNESVDVIYLDDIQIDLSGKYTTENHIETHGSLAIAVDKMKNAIDEPSSFDSSRFVSNTGGSILDWIRTIIVLQDPEKGTLFDKIRANDSLDIKLNKYFILNSINVGESLASVWNDAKDLLSEPTFGGSIDIGSGDGSEHPCSNHIDYFSFSKDIIDVSGSKTALSSVIETSDLEMFHITSYEIAIGLGDILYSLISSNVLPKHFETSEFGAALRQIVDCDAVATYMLPWLSELAAENTIAFGCLLALDGTANKMDLSAVELNAQYGVITIEGGFFNIEVPSHGSQIGLLKDGILIMTWSGTSFEGEKTIIGPMTVNFSAKLSSGNG